MRRHQRRRTSRSCRRPDTAGDAHRGTAVAPHAHAGPRARAGEPAGVADVVHGRAEHLADRLEPGARGSRRTRQWTAPSPRYRCPGSRPSAPRAAGRQPAPGCHASATRAPPSGPSGRRLHLLPAPYRRRRAACRRARLAVAASHRLRRPIPRCAGARSPALLRFLPGGVGPEPVLGRAAFIGLDRLVPEAEPPAMFGCPCRLDFQTMATVLQPGRISPIAAGAGAHLPAGVRRQDAPADGRARRQGRRDHRADAGGGQAGGPGAGRGGPARRARA